MSKTPYKPERQEIGEKIYFCHGNNILGKHVDVIMKSGTVIPENEILMAHEPAFVHSLCYLRKATDTERIEYCI